MKRILAAFAGNTVFANILLVMFFFIGGLALKGMVRETFPEFSLDMITITVPFPGADPEEVEEGIARKLEDAVEGIEGVKQYTTHSRENVGTALVEVQEDYDLQKVINDVRTQVNAISTFPVDAENPVVSELTLKDPVMLLYVSGDMSERRIKEWAETVKDEVKQLPEVSYATIYGAREYEIAVEVSEEKLRQYGLSLDAVAQALRQSNLNLSGGTIRGQGEEIRIRTIGRKYTGKSLGDVVVKAGPAGDMITLDRIATIRDDFNEDKIMATINGEPALMLIVYKTSEQDALTISAAIERYVQKRQQTLPGTTRLEILYDNTEMLRARLDLLTRNGIMGLAIVFFLLWFFLNGRLAFWAGMGIPISVAGALGILWAIGGTLNMISLFGFIMVLGIVVDDAIVVGEAIYVHRRQGDPPVAAAVNGVSEVGMPVIAAVLTTIVAFIPLMYVGGIMGKFIAIMPVVVIACLLISLVECLILLPAHLNHLPEKTTVATGPFWSQPLERLHQWTANGLERIVDKVYLPFLKSILKWRYAAFFSAVMILLLTFGVIRGGLIKFQVFPSVDGFVMTATVEFPPGTPTDRTAQAIDRIEATLLSLADGTQTASGEPLLVHRITLLGETLADIPDRGPHFGSVQAIMLPSERRGIHADELMAAWEEAVGVIPGIKALTFSGLSAGPPGDPIEVWLQGRDMAVISAAADELMARLRLFDGVFQVRSDLSTGKNEMRLTLKPEARSLGLTVQDLARQVNSGFYGDEAVRLQRGRDDVRIKVRYPENERRAVSDVMNMRIRTSQGHEIPLRSVADITFAQGFTTITRTDGMRRVAVSAGVDARRANANEVFAELKTNFFPDLETHYPGLHVALQGEQKKMRESLGSLMVGYPVAILGIFIIMATIFRSYAQPFLILFTIPFGIIGAVIGHLVLGYDLSMMSMFGMVALTGVVVNDAIVLIERVNTNLAEKMPFYDAILMGGSRRFRAIVLTTVSTVGGLAPLIMETDLQARFLIPMALSVAAGVLFATILTLVLLPSLLVILNDFRCIIYRFSHGTWPERAAVEPALDRYDDPMAAPPAIIIKTSPQSGVDK